MYLVSTPSLPALFGSRHVTPSMSLLIWDELYIWSRALVPIIVGMSSWGLRSQAGSRDTPRSPLHQHHTRNRFIVCTLLYIVSVDTRGSGPREEMFDTLCSRSMKCQESQIQLVLVLTWKYFSHFCPLDPDSRVTHSSSYTDCYLQLCWD